MKGQIKIFTEVLFNKPVVKTRWIGTTKIAGKTWPEKTWFERITKKLKKDKLQYEVVEEGEYTVFKY